MDFKELVMHDTDSKYQDMSNGATAVPFKEAVVVADYGSYDEKRDAFYARLDSEREEFNNSIAEINRRRNLRIQQEREFQDTIDRDKKKFNVCQVLTGIALIVTLLIAFAAMKNGATVWVKEILIPEAGFKYFLYIFYGISPREAGFEITILTIVFVGISWIVAFIICAIKGVLGQFAGVLFGGALASGLSFFLPFFVWRFLIFVLSYVLYFLLTPLGLFTLSAIIVIVLLLIGKRFELKRFKFKLLFNIILFVVVSSVCLYFGGIYTKESQLYYENHNGESIFTGVEMEVGKEYTAFVRETKHDDFDGYYFTFTPSKSGTYIFCAENGVYGAGELYSSSLARISRASYNSDGDSVIEKFLEEGEKYYLRVDYSEDHWGEGHFQVYVDQVYVD